MAVASLWWGRPSELLHPHHQTRVVGGVLPEAQRAGLALFLQVVEDPSRCSCRQCQKSRNVAPHSRGVGVEERLEVAHWASWAAITDIAETILAAVEARDEVPSVQAINRIVESLAEVGFVAPPWEELARDIVDPPNAEDADPNQRRAGWQASASRMVESSFLEALRPTLSDAECALLRSQGGPLASARFVSFPMSRFARLEPQVLRVLFLRRLRLPIPLTARACRCGRPLDALGHHRSACAVAGTLQRQSLTLFVFIDLGLAQKQFWPNELWPNQHFWPN